MITYHVHQHVILDRGSFNLKAPGQWDGNLLHRHTSNHMRYLPHTGSGWTGGVWGAGQSHLRGGYHIT